MHIINLSIKCKDATGDGTVIVCMNSDYVVRIKAEDCGTFTEAPVKKLVVRHDKEYYESDIVSAVADNGETVLQAILPPLERKDYVDLGICGKLNDDDDSIPVYSSKSARFRCDKSVLCGTVIKKAEPKLATLDVTENGTYKAIEHGADGFYEVGVHITQKMEEARTVSLAMHEGDQTINPTYTNRTLSSVVVQKPVTLSPDNIKKGVDIAGVVGTFEIPYYDGAAVVEDIPTDDDEQ